MLAGACAVLAGCGGSATETVTAPAVTSPAAGAHPSTTRSAPRSTGTAATSTTGGTAAQQSADGGVAAPSTTRTAAEPEFAQREPKASGVSAAVATVRAMGYTPVDPTQYRSKQTLTVLVGTLPHAGATTANGYGEKAFFFLDGRFIGTDTKQASATVRLVSQSGAEVTLAYPLYRSGDPLSAPSGGQALVHFQLDNGHLQPIGQIPPASSSSGGERR